MDDDKLFMEMLDGYLDPVDDPNPSMEAVEIVWVDNDLRLGSLHMKEKHGVDKAEVEQVLLQIPPSVEAKRSSEAPNRTLFWGATKFDRWLFVVCEDRTDETGYRFLKPITAFEPDEGVDYWRRS